MEVIFTDRFLTRVEECTDYIALDHIPTAIKWAEEIFDHCEQLRSQPGSGRMVPEFNREEIKELIHGNYRMIYEIKTRSYLYANYLAYQSDLIRKAILKFVSKNLGLVTNKNIQLLQLKMKTCIT